MNAGQIKDLLRSRYRGDGWIFFEELRLGTGSADRILDAFAMNIYRSKQLARVTFEVKVSRSDFLGETVDHPEKRAYGMNVSNQFYYVTPVNMVRVDEVPENCGLLEASLDGTKLRKKKAAVYREQPDGVPAMFVASLIADLTRAERQNPCSVLAGKTLSVEDLEAEVERRVALWRKAADDRAARQRDEQRALAEREYAYRSALEAELPGVNLSVVTELPKVMEAMQARRPRLDSGEYYRLKHSLSSLKTVADTMQEFLKKYGGVDGQ